MISNVPGSPRRDCSVANPVSSRASAKLPEGRRTLFEFTSPIPCLPTFSGVVSYRFWKGLPALLKDALLARFHLLKRKERIDDDSLTIMRVKSSRVRMNESPNE